MLDTIYMNIIIHTTLYVTETYIDTAQSIDKKGRGRKRGRVEDLRRKGQQGKKRREKNGEKRKRQKEKKAKRKGEEKRKKKKGEREINIQIFIQYLKI